MKIVIDIDEKDYCNVKNELLLCYNSEKLASKVTKVFQESVPLSQIIKKNQNIQPEMKTKKWLVHNKNYAMEYYTCSKCGKPSDYKSNFCPNCGADMRTKAERENKK